MNSKQLGAIGEKIAGDFLKGKRYKIVDKNYSNKFISGPLRGEIDIIAKKDGIIAFVEVKTASSAGLFISPEEKVNFAKQKKLMKAAESWLIEKKIPLDSKWQIDIIAIEMDSQNKKAKIRHFKNAVSSAT